jgi:2,4-dienoyl-CoA reductase-like NADH-dependent reductase (Old Yellow Enzyme family)/thioredoxin reductase
MNLTHVHTPLRIAGATLKNRVCRTAHATNIGGAGGMTDDLIAYHLARAEGGCGLLIVEIMGVHPTSPSGLNAFDPRIAKGYEKLVEAVRPTGAKVFQQLWHAGHNAHPINGGPPWSASDVPGPTVGVAPLPMDNAMIDEIVEAYAAAARLCESLGLDGVEVHCAHGYLPAQFLSPNANNRDDAYGGSFENRVRFMVEVVSAVRAAVSKDFAVGVRVAPDFTVGGLGPEENLRAALAVEPLIDYLNVSAGNYQSFPKMIGGMHEPPGYELPTAIPITSKITVPTLVTGRFRTLEEADAVIRAGEADLVALTRATIADPFLVQKTLDGHPERVRPCIACNQGCVGQLLAPPFRMGCAVNPSTGFERSFGDHTLTRTQTPGRVLVVGAGPAGLEAARVAAERGHRVVLAEAQADLGGAIRLAMRAPTRANLGDITFWLEQEVYRLGVEVRRSTFLEADDILAEGFDQVILATGSTPRMDGVQLSNPGEPIEGVDRPHVLSSQDLFASPGRDFGQDAVVIDDAGHYEAVAAAEQLVVRGAAVTYVSRLPAFAPGVESALMTEPALERLSRGRFTHLARHRAIAIEEKEVVIGPTYLPKGSNQTLKVKADTVVFVSVNRPNRELFAPLKAAGVSVRLVGDANAPRYLTAAMREGHLAGAAV